MTEPNVRRLLRVSRLCNELGHGDDVAAALDEMKRLRAENARLRRRIMTDAVTSDEAASSVANLAQSLADARAEIDLLRAALAKIAAGMCIEPCTVAREASGPKVRAETPTPAQKEQR